MKVKNVFPRPFGIVVCIFIAAFSIILQAQSKKVFKAPPSADEIKNPIPGDAASIIEGKKTYTTFCAACHGNKGKGDGVAAAGLQKPPADHTSAAVQSQSDGAIFWKLTNGNNPMPSYASLTPTQRWQLVNYIRTLAKSPKK